jgi:multiple sugar transport system substrate-binding protein
LQKNPALRDRFGIGPLPGADRYFTFRDGAEQRLKEGINRIPYLGWGGWLAVVPATASQPAAAWDLLASLSGSEVSGQTVAEPRWGGGVTRMEQLRRERWDGFDLDGPRTTALKEAIARSVVQHGIKNPVLCLRIPDQATHRTALVGEVRAALEKGGDAAEALRAVVRRWKELDAKRGAKTREEYRISLGLLKE